MGAIVEIHDLIQRLADEGKAVVVISSYLPEIMALSDRILVSRQGKVVEEFSALEATEEKSCTPRFIEERRVFNDVMGRIMYENPFYSQPEDFLEELERRH